MAEDERHIGDELDETIDNANDAASDVRDAANTIKDFKNANKKGGEENRSDGKDDPSQSGSPSDKKGAESTSTSDGGTSSGGKNAGDNTFFSGGGKGAGAEAAEGAASGARQAGEDATTEAAKKIVEEASKDVVSEFGATAAGGAVGGAHGALIGFAIDLIRKALKYIISGFVILLLIITIMLCILPMLLFRLFITEICIQITQATCEIYDNIFGIEGWDEASDETKREFAKVIVDEFFGDVEETVDGIWGTITDGAYTFFQFLDDNTDDDTWYGSFFDSAANWNYNQSVSIDIKQMKKEMEENGQTYDGNAVMCYLVIEKLRDCYADVDGYVSIDDMRQEVQEKKQKLLDTYTTVNMDKYSGDEKDAEAWMFFFDNTSDPFIQGYLPVTNIPIVITGEDNFVTNNGEYVGEVVGDKQYLRDNIMYNPYGNKRSTLSLSTGSDYEMMCHAAYIIAVYSVCTPYADQSIAGLLTAMNDGMHQAKKEANIDLVDYDAKFTEVYYGAIVPRVYQPYLYKADDTSVPGAPSEYLYMPGAYQEGYFESHNTGERAIIGMGPTNIDGYHLVDPTGWFDVNGDLIVQDDEILPMVLQQLDIPSDGQKAYYPDSFCVVTSDKFYCNINEDTGMRYVLNTPVDSEGYYIYGSNTTEYEHLPYSKIDWTDELNSQIKKQDNLLPLISDDLEDQYVYRFQFPFTRISTGWNDDGVSQVTRVVPIVVNDATKDSGEYPELYRMGWVSGNYRNGDYIYQTWSNGGQFNGYQAWVYLDAETQKRVSLTEGELHETVTDFNVFALDNWTTDTVGVPSDPGKSNEAFVDKPYLYNAKIRYMISINITAIPHYFDFVTECFGYKPNSPVYRGLTYKNYYRPEPEYETDAEGLVKQGYLATGSLKMYMELLGMDEETIVANNPQIGTEPTYTYEDMMTIIRNVRNADGTEASPNQKYLVYTGICALGHVMYQWAGDSGPGLDFQKWMTTIPNAKKDPKNKMPYEYFGLDCSGFISWIYKSTFFPEMSRFDSSSVITIYGDEKTTFAVRQGRSTAASYLGDVFWDPTKLQVGDIAVRRKMDEKGNLSGHVVMYCGKSPNDPDKQLWIEMTRFDTSTNEYGQVNGARLFEMFDYGATRDAVYISTHNLLPKEDAEWTIISPSYMLIPSRNEIMSTHYDSKLGKQSPTEPGQYDLSGMVIVLDPGHQAHANSDTEQVAPWSNDKKAKVSAGTKGVATGRPEYEVVLEIALKMRDYLESMGATVIMTRTTNDVNISNIERAQIATSNNADVFIRLHCDDSDSSSARGIGVFVCSKGELADSQVTWGNWLGECMSDATGSNFRGTNASTTYSGLNWATSVPSFLLEMGFMSNREDDKLLSDPEYQDKICYGAAAFCYKMKQSR